MPRAPSSSSSQTLAPSPAEHPHPHRQLPAGRVAPLRLSGDRPLTRLLVNVTVDRSLWPVQLVLAADATVADLVRAAVAAYQRERRRPPLLPHRRGDDVAAEFDLHFSKYSLECLRPEEKVVDLGSRNFFLCPRRSATAACFV